MPLSTADIVFELLTDVANGLSDIQSRMPDRAFGAVHNPREGPEVRRVLDDLLAVLDRMSTDGVI